MAEPHTHLREIPCDRFWDCDHAGPEMVIVFGPVTGLLEVARQLILHFEIDPDEHGGLLLEVESAIGDQMLDTAREIFTERGIRIPAEVGALPLVAIGSKPTGGKGGS